MNQAEPDGSCERCDDVLADQCFVVRVAADPPSSGTFEMRICERCMTSLTRWVTRRSSPKAGFEGMFDGDRPASGEASSSSSRGRGKRSGRRGRGDIRDVYAKELEESDDWVRRKDFVVVAAIVGGVLALGGFYYAATTFGSLRWTWR